MEQEKNIHSEEPIAHKEDKSMEKYFNDTFLEDYVNIQKSLLTFYIDFLEIFHDLRLDSTLKEDKKRIDNIYRVISKIKGELGKSRLSDIENLMSELKNRYDLMPDNLKNETQKLKKPTDKLFCTTPSPSVIQKEQSLIRKAKTNNELLEECKNLFHGYCEVYFKLHSILKKFL